MNIDEFASALLASFSLIGLAEIGDKSQIVCMTLAARYHRMPVLLGATAAFLLLNTLAVVFGASVAAWLPERLIAAIVALLFAGFGLLALVQENEEEPAEIAEQRKRSAFFAALTLIFIAEFGDKTQIAVASLSSSLPPAPVWTGATAALILISALGVWFGSALLQRLPARVLHRLSGLVFLIFAAVAAWRAIG